MLVGNDGYGWLQVLINVQGWLLTFTATWSAYVAREMVFPSSSKSGFYVGFMASQLHLPLLTAVGFSMWLASPFPATPSTLDILAAGVTASACSLMLYDFVHGIDWSLPSKSFGTSLFRVAQMAFPPLWLVYDRVSVNKHRDIVFCEHDKVAVLLDVITPPNTKQNANLPVFLFFHGGAWVQGSKDYVGLLVVNAVARNGFVVVSANYRLSTMGTVGGASWPDHIADVKRAILWTKQHIAQYGGDPQNIIIAGNSAGAHLAALAALTPHVSQFQPGFETEDTTVQGCASLYGVFDFVDLRSQWRDWDTHHGRRHADHAKPPIIVSFLQKFVIKERFETHRHLFEMASPAVHASKRVKDHVPFFVAHGDRDILVPVSEAKFFHETLNPARSVFVCMKGGHHAFDSVPSPRAFALIDHLNLFLDRFKQKEK